MDATPCLACYTVDNATLIGVVGMVVGGIGAATGIIAVAYAHVAKTAAEKANEIAGDSKTLAGEANTLARESNTLAADARRLAEEANTYSHRAEARETEGHDVHWDGEWERPGIYVLTKRGDDEAHNVKATVTCEGEEVTVTADQITEDGSSLEFDFPLVAAGFQAEARARMAKRDRERRQREREPYGELLLPLSAGISSWQSPDMHFLSQRVTWMTSLDAPKIHTDDRVLTTFDEFYDD